MTWTFETLASFDDELTGPAWDGGGLLFCRPGKSEIHRFDPAATSTALVRHSVWQNRGLAVGHDGRLYGAQSRPRRVVWYRDDGSTWCLNTMLDGRRHNDPQDLAVDAAGRVWFADLWTAESFGGPVGWPPLGHSSILRLERVGDGPAQATGPRGTSGPAAAGEWSLRRMTFDTIGPRALAFSPDERTLYVADGAAGAADDGPAADAASPAHGATGRLLAYAVAEDGSLGSATVLRAYEPADSGPVALCVNRDGSILVAAGSSAAGPGSRIEIVAPDGRLVETHEVPTGQPTGCAFGGKDLGTLFVTTASGSLCCVRDTGRTS